MAQSSNYPTGESVKITSQEVPELFHNRIGVVDEAWYDQGHPCVTVSCYIGDRRCTIDLFASEVEPY